MANGNVTWGLIGSSGWADSTFGPSIQDASNSGLGAVLSSSAANADAFCAKHGVAKGYSDLGSFVSDDGFDAVWIATPHDLHAEQTIAALEAGKHVLIDKPMAVSVAECEAMIDAAEKADRLLSIGYHMRQHSLHREIQESWSRGDFGAPVFARAHCYYPYPEPPGTWREDPRRSGGWAVGDVGTHLIDLVRWFLGDATEVHGGASNHRFGLGVEDFSLVAMGFENGAHGIADSSVGAGSGGPRLELYGTEAFCVLDGTLFGGGGTVSRASRGEDLVTTDAPVEPLYQRQVEAFNRAVLGEEGLRVTARDGLENVRIIEQARGW